MNSIQPSGPGFLKRPSGVVAKAPGGVRFERTSPSGHYIEVSYKPLDNGTIISIHRNITELKEREASLAAAKEAAEAARADTEHTRQVMQTVLDNMGEGVQMLDKDFRVEFVNRRMLELQKEQIALMREGNPLMGCLPLLIQLPFFYAVFTILTIAIEVRHAHFFGWITDLSSPDAYYILPIVMCVTMIAQTALTPTTGDPMQKRISESRWRTRLPR
jgi:YidC/Oxa1 family membrane protein insertase